MTDHRPPSEDAKELQRIREGIAKAREDAAAGRHPAHWQPKYSELRRHLSAVGAAAPIPDDPTTKPKDKRPGRYHLDAYNVPYWQEDPEPQEGETR